MNIKEMHYDFKQKLNKIDSQKNRDLIVPEIDWKLNEAIELFVMMIAEPELSQELGFEATQRTIDDIRTIVVDQRPSEAITPLVYDEISYISDLPSGYWYYLNSNILCSKGTCTGIKVDTVLVEHDDRNESSYFDKSSFEWRVSNVRFNNKGLRIFTDGTFKVDKVWFEYIKRPAKVHNAEDFIGGTYTALNGTVLTGTSNCDLPEGTHGRIVDIAVLITAGDLSLPDYQLKQAKIGLGK